MMKLCVLGALSFVFSPSLLNAAPVGGECLGGDICTRDADYGSYGDYGSYQPPANGYGKYSSYGSYPREAEPEADPEPLELRQAKSYGKYSNYGSYAPPAKGYGKYSTYGKYPREAEPDAEPKTEPKAE